MKLQEQEIGIPSAAGDIRVIVIRPVEDEPRPGLLVYSDIFQFRPGRPGAGRVGRPG